MEIQGKTAIVTGAAGGLGRQLVQRLLVEGAKVTALDLSAKRLADLANEAAHPALRCDRCDVTDPEAIERVIEACLVETGRIDILVNNAGLIHSAPLVSFGASGFTRHSIADWERVIATNLSSVFYVTRTVVEMMLRKRTRGVIVNLSSVSAGGNAGQSAYSASKAAVNALTRTWAKELGPLGVRVVAVAPGYIETESTSAALSSSVADEIKGLVALRRFGHVDEIIEAVVTVVRNDYFNGRVFEVDGGLFL